MKRVISLALALSMMFMCAGNVFAADYGKPTIIDSGKDIRLTLFMGGNEVDIEVPATEYYQDSDSGNVTNKFFAIGTSVKTGIEKITNNTADDTYAEYADAQWYTDAEYTKVASFNSNDRYFCDMDLYAKLGKAPNPGADVEVSEEVKSEGISADQITNTLPADTKLTLAIAETPATTAQKVVDKLAADNATLKAVAGSQPLYLDLKLLDKEGKPVQPGASASITLPIPDKMHTALNNGANAVLVIHYNDDGTMKDYMFASLADGKMTFNVSSFSTFAFIAVEKTSFDVTVENVKGGILSVIDANGVIVPVGQKVAVPSKATKDGYTSENKLYVTFIALENTAESDLLVNGTSVGIDGDYHEIQLSQDVVLTGVFVADDANDEKFTVYVKPSSYNSEAPFSGTLQFKHRQNGKDTALTNATFAFDGFNYEDLFEINGNTLTSKQPLTEQNYFLNFKVTVGDKVYIHEPTATPEVDCQVALSNIDQTDFYVGFTHYLAEQFEANDGGRLGNANDVPKNTSFDAVAKNEANFYNGQLKDGKPQMYNHEFDRWQQYTWADDSDYLTSVNVSTVTSDLYAMAMFKNYRVNVQPLGGSGGGGGGGSGGSGGSGGGSSLLGGSLASSISQAVTTAQAKTAVNKAINSAKASGSTEAVVRFKNAKSIPASALQTIVTAARKAGMNAVIYADTIVDKVVVTRLYIDLEKLDMEKNLVLGVTLGDKKIEAKFNKYFSNEISVINFAQTGAFGTSVKVAAMADLGDMNTKTLRFYSYNAKTGKYSEMKNVKYAFNKDGYIFFDVTAGDAVIITDRPLASK